MANPRPRPIGLRAYMIMCYTRGLLDGNFFQRLMPSISRRLVPVDQQATEVPSLVGRLHQSPAWFWENHNSVHRSHLWSFDLNQLMPAELFMANHASTE